VRSINWLRACLGGNDDRRLQWRSYEERDGLSQNEKGERQKINTMGIRPSLYLVNLRSIQEL